MKILWFCNTAANGQEFLGQQAVGSGTWLQALNIMLEKEVDLTVAFHHEKDKRFYYGKTNYIAIGKYDTFFIKIIMKFKERFFNKVLDEDLINKYLQVIDEIKPDVIHIHGTENSFGCVIKHTNIPVVTSIQGVMTVWLHKFMSGFPEKYLHVRDFSTKNLKQFIFPTNFNNAKKKFIEMSRVELKNIKNCKNFIGRTDWDRRITSVMSKDSKYFYNSEVIREEFFKHQWLPCLEDENKVLIHTTTDNVFYKGFETICQTIRVLDEIGVVCQWRIAGLNKNDLIVKVVKDMMGKSFPNTSLIFLGKCNAEEIVQSILKSDLYVMPSHIENSPNSLCEAMILGIPCISTWSGGSGSLMVDGEEGLLIQDGDPWAMAGAILQIKKNKIFAKKIANKGQQKAKLRHDKDKILSDLLKIYKTIQEPHIIN